MGVTLRSPNRQRALVGVTWHRSALPLRIELLEPVGLGRLLRHEYGHCNGLIHPDGKLDKWREVVGSEREKIAALVHRQWLEITGRREVAPARNAESATAAPPLKPRRDVALRAPRAFSGEGY